MVLLLFMLVAVSASSYVVLQAANAGTAGPPYESARTLAALRVAKEALLGYAVSYGDTHGASKGPGHLPCPDREGGNGFGVAETGIGASPDCTIADDAETGLLPFRTLGLAALTDASGAPLWYAVSDNHRSTRNPPLNSETPGLLEVDGRDDVVAVVIAPGAAGAGQAHGGNGLYSATDYLEGENASPGDGRFASRYTGNGNDTVVTITRAELAAAIERRVIGEVARALSNYYSDPDADDDAGGADPECGADPDCDDGYPWLSPFEDPSTSDHAGEVDVFASGTVTAGHLPLLVPGVAFDSGFSAAWSVMTAAASYGASGAEPPSESCLRSTSSCTQAYTVSFVGGPMGMSGQVPVPHAFGTVSGQPGGGWAQGECSFAAPEELECTATYDFTLTSFIGTGTRNLRREYRFEFTSNTSLAAPTASQVRTIQVVRSGSWTGAAGRITVTDREMPAGTVIGSASLDFGSLDPSDDFSLTGVPFDLEIGDALPIDRERSPGALPQWFHTNQWHHLVAVQYARAHSPGAVAIDCADDGSCLTVTVTRPGGGVSTAADDIGGVVMAAGPALDGATPQARPGTLRSDYFEGNNGTPVSADADWRETSGSFNDQVRVLER